MDPSVAGPSIDSGDGPMPSRKPSDSINEPRIEKHEQAHIMAIEEQSEDYDVDTKTEYSDSESLQSLINRAKTIARRN